MDPLNCDCEVQTQQLAFSLFSTKGTYRSHKWVDEASTDAGTNISDWQNKSSGCPLLVRHVGQRQVCLGHANRQGSVALVKEKRHQEKRLMYACELVSVYYGPFLYNKLNCFEFADVMVVK